LVNCRTLKILSSILSFLKQKLLVPNIRFPAGPFVHWVIGNIQIIKVNITRIWLYQSYNHIKEVVFPAPLGPRRPTISPWFTSTEMPLRHFFPMF
jgi:hypothetical protein